MTSATKVITGKHTVFSYLTVNDPRVPLGGGTPKYSVSLIIPKSDTETVEKIRKAIRAAYEEGQNKLRGALKSVPALEDIRSPLRDGDKDRKGDPAYADSWFLNASSDDKPDVVDAHRRFITNTRELYSGIIGKASINFFAYNVNGNRGIGCGLNNLQKLRDGTPLGSRSRAEDDFEDEDVDEDDDFLS